MGVKAASPQTPAAATREFWQTGAHSLRIIDAKEDSTASVVVPSACSEHLRKLLPDASASVPQKSDEMGAATAATLPVNFSAETSSDTFDSASGTVVSRYRAPYYSSLRTASVNSPGIFHLLESLSLSAGLDAMWPSLTFKRFFPSFMFGAADDGPLSTGSDKWNNNGNRGIVWNLTKHQHLAIVYRVPTGTEYPPADEAGAHEAGQGTALDGEINPTAEAPNIITLGYEFDLTDTIRLRTEFEWLELAPYRSGTSDFGTSSASLNQLSLAGGTGESSHNNFTSGIGGDWKFMNHWVMHLGYQFFKSPLPNSSFAPNNPEANQNIFTLGIGWSGKRSSLEAAYGLDFYNNQRYTGEQNIAINGNYAMNVHLMSLAYHFTF
jgi:long-subunit fatty acid transport protein